jgi:hypothetical protein
LGLDKPNTTVNQACAPLKEVACHLQKEKSVSKSWNHDRAADHIDKKMEDVKEVIIKEYARDMSLESIPKNVGYRVDGVHMYADILNLDDMLNATDAEGPECHRRTLRFLDQHYRAVKRILDRVDARRVDFHSQRLHSLFTKPYNSEDDGEKKRIQRAVATAQLIIDVLSTMAATATVSHSSLATRPTTRPSWRATTRPKAFTSPMALGRSSVSQIRTNQKSLP